MVALELVRQWWVVGMLVGGVALSGWVFLALYAGPERPGARGEGADAAEVPEPPAEAHEFFGGIREGNLPVPTALKLFFLGMALFAVSYLLWVRFQVIGY